MPYFDYAATSLPKPQEVTDAVCRAMQEFGNPSRSAHGYALEATRCVTEARHAVANLFGCSHPGRVVFTKNATEALNIAIASVGGHLITTEAEHNSLLRPAHRHQNTTIVPVDEQGNYSLSDIAAAVRKDTAAIAVGHLSNLTGNPAPVEEIGRFCRENGLLFILDVAQSGGLLPVYMEQWDADAVCFSGHKSLWGPQGTGGLCLAPHFTPAPLLVGGSGSRSFSLAAPDKLPDRLEAGTINAHGIVGLLAGIKYLRKKGLSTVYLEATRLAKLFYSLVWEIPGIHFYGDYTLLDRAPIVSLNLGELPSSEVADRLWQQHQIAVRAGIHCAPLLHMQFGTEAQGIVRFSFSHLNTAKEVEQAATALREIAGQ